MHFFDLTMPFLKRVRKYCLRVPCNAPIEKSDQEYFTVTHCFHPLYKSRFKLLEHHRNWGENKVGFFDDQDALSYMPVRWTDRFPPDVFTVFSKGRAYFSIDGLIELSALIKSLEQLRKDSEDVK